jgi:hypothetical protein
MALDCLPPPMAANENHILMVLAFARGDVCDVTTPSRRASSR